MDILVDQLSALADDAANHGVTLCVEPLNRFETSFINLAAQAIELVDRVNKPACQIMLDTFHMCIEDDPKRCYSRRWAAPETCPRLRERRGAPGTGHVPWNDVAQASRTSTDDRPVSMNPSPQVKSMPAPLHLASPAESPESLALKVGVSEKVAGLIKFCAPGV
jgi:D-psicose/D-tagatose/L-ribulose 3-epimerase